MKESTSTLSKNSYPMLFQSRDDQVTNIPLIGASLEARSRRAQRLRPLAISGAARRRSRSGLP